MPGVRAVLGPERAVHDGRRSGPHGRAALGGRTRRRRRGRHARTRWPRGSRRSRSRTRSSRRSTSTPVSRSSASRRSRARRSAAIPTRRIAGAEVIVELSCETPAHVQTPLEPHAAVARWDGDRLTAWVSTQGMFDARRELATRFGLPSESVRVISEFIGGGFGAKQGAGVEALLAAELARAAGRPVRLALSTPRGPDRRRTARPDAPDRHASARAATGRCRRSSSPRSSRWAPAAGSSPSPSPPCPSTPATNVRTMVFPVRTSLRAQNAFRAPGVVEGVTVLDQAMDELAARLELDPLELRRLNHVDTDQGSRAALFEQAAARVLRPRRRARRLVRARCAPRAGRRRAPARHGLRDADLVGRRRAARACVDPPRRRRHARS